MSFLIARSIDDALDALAAGARPIAGGSDLVVSARHGATALPERLVAVDRIRELGTIDELDDGSVVIGAGVTHARLMADPVISFRFSALADAAALVGSPSTRNVGTLGGNVMNASPAMDTGAPLVVLGATVELRSQSAMRELEIRDLWSGPGQTAATSQELCTLITLPRRAVRSGSAYVRLEYRRAMEIAVVGAAAAVSLGDDGTVISAAVALTAVGPTIISVDHLSETIGGKVIDEATLNLVSAAASERSLPISDLRASDTYRRHTVGVMARRAVEAAALRAGGQTLAVPVNRAMGIGANQ